MIRSFKHRDLDAFWQRDDASKLRPDQVDRIHRRLSALDQAVRPEEMNLPG